MPLANQGIWVCLWAGRGRKLSRSPGVALRLDGAELEVGVGEGQLKSLLRELPPWKEPSHHDKTETTDV